jgi:hypothetical protein
VGGGVTVAVGVTVRVFVPNLAPVNPVVVWQAAMVTEAARPNATGPKRHRRDPAARRFPADSHLDLVFDIASDTSL